MEEPVGDKKEQKQEEQKQEETMQEATLKFLMRFLQGAVEKGGDMDDWHGMFHAGTVVRFPAPDVDSLKRMEFADDAVYDFPVHRLLKPAVLPQILSGNQKIYNETLTRNNEFEPMVISAYDTLISDGYPYPGGQGADRFPITPGPEGGPGLVMWPARSPYVYNAFAHPDPTVTILPMQLTVTCGELRRADFIEPRLYALISPDLELHRLEPADAFDYPSDYSDSSEASEASEELRELKKTQNPDDFDNFFDAPEDFSESSSGGDDLGSAPR